MIFDMNTDVNKYPIGYLLSEINRCYGCFVDYLLENMDEQYHVTELIVKTDIESFISNIEMVMHRDVY